jgi:hypothetical protein
MTATTEDVSIHLQERSSSPHIHLLPRVSIGVIPRATTVSCIFVGRLPSSQHTHVLLARNSHLPDQQIQTPILHLLRPREETLLAKTQTERSSELGDGSVDRR